MRTTDLLFICTVLVVAFKLSCSSAQASESWGDPVYDEGDHRYYAVTESVRYSNVIATVSASPPACDPGLFIATMFKEYLEPYPARTIEIKLRVDGGTIYTASGGLQAMGNGNWGDYRSRLLQTLQLGDAIGDFMDGKRLIVKAGGSVTDEFSLQGSTKALIGVVQRCLDLQAPASDEWSEPSDDEWAL